MKDLGVAKPSEILDYILDAGIKGKTEITLDRIYKHLEKWRGRKVVAITYLQRECHYKIAGVPPWFTSLDMSDLVKGHLKGLKDILNKIKEWAGPNTYHDYHKYKVKIRTLTPILGGWVTRPSNSQTEEEPCEGDNPKQYLKRDMEGNPVIALNNIRAWHRDNFPLIGIPKSVFRHIAFTDVTGEFTPEWRKQIKVKVAFCDYEAVPPGTEMEYMMNVPNKGKTSVSPEQFINLYEEAKTLSIRGLGANPFVFGGKFELIELDEVSS